MRDSQRHHLNEASAALSDRDAGRALTVLLESWRETRDERTADLIIQLSKLLERPELPQERTQKEELLRWVERARQRQDVDLDVLLKGFRSLWDRGRRFRVLLALDELRDWPPDPRMTQHLLDLVALCVEAGHYDARVWERLLELLVDTGDPAALSWTVPLRTAANDETKAWFGEHMPTCRAQLAERLAGTTVVERREASSEHTALATLVETLGPMPVHTLVVPPNTTEQLLSAVYQNPDDDGARLVLADRLLEEGDPLGELIALQMRRHLGEAPTEASRAREATLLRRHGTEWLGPLARWMKWTRVRWARGFPVSCQVEPIPPALAEAEAHHRPWATIERVSFTPRTKAWTSLVSAEMRAMRAMLYLHHRDVVKLCEELHHLPIVELMPFFPHFSSDRHGDIAPLKALARCEGLIDLRVLQIMLVSVSHPDELAFFFDSPIGKRLDTLVILGRHDWLAEEIPVRRLVVGMEREWWIREQNDDKAALSVRLPVSRLGTRASQIRAQLVESNAHRFDAVHVELACPDEWAADNIAAVHQVFGDLGLSGTVTSKSNAWLAEPPWSVVPKL